MSVRVGRYEIIPDFRWFITGARETHDGREARFAILKLPTYRWMLNVYSNRMGWHRAWLVYDGHYGISIEWVAP